MGEEANGSSLETLSRALAAGETSSVRLLDAALRRATDPAGEGARAFVALNGEDALRMAREADALRARGAGTPWTGIPVSVKDLFDVAGEVTTAGSVVLRDAAPAARSAPAIQRLRDAGFVLVGRTNMTEFAYSGVGINPHYGTPRNPWDRAVGRIPGGSSSGAAVSVADGMAAVAIGTDTGGSCRIPAALCGLVGYKPTAAAVPLEGVYPLAGSLDSVGSLGRTVACCAVAHDILAGGAGRVPAGRAPASLSFAVLDHYVTGDLDATVAAAYQGALERLSAAGVRLTPIRLPEIEALPGLNARGGLAAAEAWAFHREQIARAGDAYDPRVRDRIRAGSRVTTAELAEIRRQRAAMMASFARAMAPYQAVLCPTVPLVAPALSEFEADEDYVALNLKLLRNPSVFNFLDGCAISLPVHEPGCAPVGLMLAAPGGRDAALLAAAMCAEELLRP